MPYIGFAEPRHLHLIIPLLALIVAGFLVKWRLSRRFEEFFEGQNVSISGLSPARSWIKGTLLSSAFAAMVVASGGPFVGSKLRAPSFMAIVDISQSMWCEDHYEEGARQSRLEAAKRNLLSLLDELTPESRFGLGVFAGRSDPVLILTPPQQVESARDDLKSMVQAIQYYWTWEDGTNIRNALAYFGKTLDEKKKHYGTGLTLMILTDGEENTGFMVRAPEVEPQKFSGVHLVFAGFGTETGAPIPEFDENWQFKQYRQKYDGTTLVSRLDEGNLMGLARIFNGSYRRIKAASDLNALLKHETFKSAEYESRIDVSWALWLGSFVLLVFSKMI